MCDSLSNCAEEDPYANFESIEVAQRIKSQVAALSADDYLLELEDLGFSYGKKRVLNQVDMALGSGVIVRVAGTSGAGKSTLLKLIERFWDPSLGRIKILGKDIREIPFAYLRQALSYMDQDTYLFNTSLRNNIALGNPAATDEEIYAALKKASALEIVQALPDGLDADCAQVGFSSGERQRLGLARTLLYDAPIMLLDEPSGNLDSQTEAAILLALKNHCADKTIILVSHRPGSALIADATFVL